MPVELTHFTRAMARVPGPVTVTTTVDDEGRSWGFTASSFSSLSARPPLILICLDKAASTHAAFVSATHFLVNVLGAGQAGVAQRFATSGADRFAAGDMRPCEKGLPGLPTAPARIACALHDVLDGGDHSILVGRAESVHIGSGPPLVYCDRSFVQPASALPRAGG